MDRWAGPKTGIDAVDEVTLIPEGNRTPEAQLIAHHNTKGSVSVRTLSITLQNHPFRLLLGLPNYLFLSDHVSKQHSYLSPAAPLRQCVLHVPYEQLLWICLLLRRQYR